MNFNTKVFRGNGDRDILTWQRWQRLGLSAGRATVCTHAWTAFPSEVKVTFALPIDHHAHPRTLWPHYPPHSTSPEPPATSSEPGSDPCPVSTTPPPPNSPFNPQLRPYLCTPTPTQFPSRCNVRLLFHRLYLRDFFTLLHDKGLKAEAETAHSIEVFYLPAEEAVTVI